VAALVDREDPVYKRTSKLAVGLGLACPLIPLAVQGIKSDPLVSQGNVLVVAELDLLDTLQPGCGAVETNDRWMAVSTLRKTLLPKNLQVPARRCSCLGS